MFEKKQQILLGLGISIPILLILKKLNDVNKELSQAKRYQTQCQHFIEDISGRYELLVSNYNNIVNEIESIQTSISRSKDRRRRNISNNQGDIPSNKNIQLNNNDSEAAESIPFEDTSTFSQNLVFIKEDNNVYENKIEEIHEVPESSPEKLPEDSPEKSSEKSPERTPEKSQKESTEYSTEELTEESNKNTSEQRKEIIKENTTEEMQETIQDETSESSEKSSKNIENTKNLVKNSLASMLENGACTEDSSVVDFEIKSLEPEKKEKKTYYRKSRLAPNKEAKNFDDGYTIVSENDGCKYSVKISSNGNHRWVKIT